MKKKSSFTIISIALAILTAIYVIAFFHMQENIVNKNTTSTHNTKQLCFDISSHPCFRVEVADTNEKRKTGLMYVEYLSEQEGMLFTYEKEGIYNFWMKNTLIPLDMIRIDKNKNIVDIQTAQPCKADPCPKYIPQGKAQYILEINAGLSKKLGISTGNTIIF